MEKNNQTQYEACLVLSAVGDAMGYKEGDWEFNYNGQNIHAEMNRITSNKGPLALQINKNWIYSDDTVMHIATAKALEKTNSQQPVQEIAKNIAIQYKKCWSEMPGRAPGNTTLKSVISLFENGSNWNQIPFNKAGGGCGGSMRSACIGLVFPKIQKVIAVAVQSGRITHNNPIGYLGSVVSACFTYYAIRKMPVSTWGARLFQQVLPEAENYIKSSGRDVEKNLGQPWKYFVDAWSSYLKLRKLSFQYEQPSQPQFPIPYSVKERQAFYKSISFDGWGGSSGHDSVIIAYDAILGCKGSWQQFCLRGILHGGDNDSTGTIGGAWFGAMFGYKGVPENHIKQLQNVNTLKELGNSLYKVSKSVSDS